MTVTVQVSVLVLSSFDVTVIVTFSPAATAVTLPFWSTDATSLLLEDQVTSGLYASSGLTVRVNVCSHHSTKEILSSVIDTELT